MYFYTIIHLDRYLWLLGSPRSERLIQFRFQHGHCRGGPYEVLRIIHHGGVRSLSNRGLNIFLSLASSFLCLYYAQLQI